MFFASNLKNYAGLSYKDQADFRSTVATAWASFTEPVNAQRRNCQNSVSLQNRYLLAVLFTVQPLIWFRRRKIRRAAMFWAAGTWFACPEWPRAYWKPARSMAELLSAEQANDGQQ